MCCRERCNCSYIHALIAFSFFFQVSVGGYNHKLRILLETIIEKVVKFEVKPDRFYVIKVIVNWSVAHQVQYRHLQISCVIYFLLAFRQTLQLNGGK